jgi:Uma2 family endonuclease
MTHELGSRLPRQENGEENDCEQRARILSNAIAHLPVGSTSLLTNVTWDEYETLVAELGDHTPVRVTYYEGRLEAARPNARHDRLKALLSGLVYIVSEALDCDLESFGSTTFKLRALTMGVEPDACFYVQNASRVIGTSDLDLDKDPPPDVTAEIDVSHVSTTKLVVYAAMKVPEVWRYDGAVSRMVFAHLTEAGYVEIASSRAFPLLTSATLTDFLEKGKKEGQTATLRTFRKWLRDRVSQ